METRTSSAASPRRPSGVLSKALAAFSRARGGKSNSENGNVDEGIIFESNPDAEVQLELADVGEDVQDYQLPVPAAPKSASKRRSLSLRASLSGVLARSRNKSQQHAQRGDVGRMRAVTTEEAPAASLDVFAASRSALGSDWASRRSSGKHKLLRATTPSTSSSDDALRLLPAGGDDALGALLTVAKARSLSASSPLHVLDLSGNTSASPEALLDVFAALLSGGVAADVVDASRCLSLGEAAMRVPSVCPSKKHKLELSELRLRMNLMSAASASALCGSLLQHRKTRVMILDLSGNPLGRPCGSRGQDALLDLFSSAAETVEDLRLRACELSDDAVDALASALERGTRPSPLRRVDLGGNPFGDAGVRTLCAALATGNASVRALDLSYCDAVSAASCKPLATLLPSLRELDLRSCGVGDEGCAALARSLRKSSSKLRALTVGGPVLRPRSRASAPSAEGAALLLECLKTNASLVELEFSAEMVGSDARFVVGQLIAAPKDRRTARLRDTLLLADADREGQRLQLSAMAQSMADEDLPVFLACMRWLQESGGPCAAAAVSPALA